jgi:hypothetical protein
MLEGQGFLVARVEQRLPIPDMYVTKDCFGFGDLLAIKPGEGTILVQSTSAPNLNAREKKARALPALYVWLECGNRFVLHGWKKGKNDRGREVWMVTEREIVCAESKTAFRRSKS